MLLTQTSQLDFDKLCHLDVLDLEDSAENDQLLVYEEFQEQLERSPEGWYETRLPWKSNHAPLPTNEIGSCRRLENLLKRLKSSDQYDDYNDIITQQLKDGVIEPAPQKASDNKEFYIPHKAAVKNTAESTKLRVVYDASARETRTSPSLNECLNPGPRVYKIFFGLSWLGLDSFPSYSLVTLKRHFFWSGSRKPNVMHSDFTGKHLEVTIQSFIALQERCSASPVLLSYSMVC